MKRNGIVLKSIPTENQHGHAAAFIKSSKGFYLMRPNPGLVSCDSLSVLTDCFLEETAFSDAGKVPHCFILFKVA